MSSTEIKHDYEKEYKELLQVTTKAFTAWNDYKYEKGSDAKKRKLHIVDAHMNKAKVIIDQNKKQQQKEFDFLAK